ncbi:MAG TPA: formate/nitrite transporter family protein [Gemmatimonadota bacterium]|nr:formate/nitrite transporter family protein [Gemmatimonadota bacterium]
MGDRFSWEEIHQRLLASAAEEIGSGVRELFFSGVTAGFAIVLTFIGFAVGTAQFPDNDFLAALLYPVGFVYIILGRYQLYTENTLPPVKLVLMRFASLPLLLRLWGTVLVANLTGAALGALVLARTHVLSPEAIEAGAGLALHGLEGGAWTAFFKALFAGWLVAGVVWLGYAARDSVTRLLLVYIVFYMIAVAELFHVVTAAADVLFFVFLGAPGPGLGALAAGFWFPVLLGNTVGGVLVFTLLAYAQAESGRLEELPVLSLRDSLLSLKGGRKFSD